MPPGVACRLFLEHSARVRAAAPRLRHEPARGLEQRRRRAALGAHRVVRRVQQVVELAAPEHQVPRLHEHSRHAVKKHAPVPSAARLDDGAAARVSRTNARFRSGTVLARLRLRVVVVVVAVVGVVVVILVLVVAAVVVVVVVVIVAVVVAVRAKAPLAVSSSSRV